LRDKGYDERGMDDGSYLFFVSGSPGGSKFEENLSRKLEGPKSPEMLRVT
jgi:hypothetical protein